MYTFYISLVLYIWLVDKLANTLYTVGDHVSHALGVYIRYRYRNFEQHQITSTVNHLILVEAPQDIL